MTDPLIGRTLAQYRIDHRLGSGGMSVVYAAHDLRLDRRVALKILTGTDDAARDRLLHEARTASALSHPQVAGIHAVEEAEGEQAFAERQRIKEQHGAGPELLKLYSEAYERGGIRGYRELDLKRPLETWDGWHGDAWGTGTNAATLGHVDLAFDWLDRAVEASSGFIV